MAALLTEILELHLRTWEAGLIMATLLLMTPTVFFAVQRLFDWIDRMWTKFRPAGLKKEKSL